MNENPLPAVSVAPAFARNYAPYGWLVYRDIFDGKDVKVIGPSSIAPEVEAKLLAGEGQEYEMRDDDNELYYRGRYIGPDDEMMFGPLDDYGMPNAGAVNIAYKQGAAYVII